jgi:hypothetical protein
MARFLTRALSRLLISLLFIHAGISKLYSWHSVVAWTLDTMVRPIQQLLGVFDQT